MEIVLFVGVVAVSSISLLSDFPTWVSALCVYIVVVVSCQIWVFRLHTHTHTLKQHSHKYMLAYRWGALL